MLLCHSFDIAGPKSLRVSCGDVLPEGSRGLWCWSCDVVTCHTDHVAGGVCVIYLTYHDLAINSNLEKISKYMVSSKASTLPLNISTPPIQRSHPLIKNIMCPPPPFYTVSGTEVSIPWFTDVIHKTIQNFRFFKTCLSCFDVMILHLKTFSNIP